MAVLLIPKESRPWTGDATPTRFIPSRVATPPPWLNADEQTLVERVTRDGFIELIEGQGYSDALALLERLGSKYYAAEKERHRRFEMVNDVKEVRSDLARLGRTHGLDGQVVESMDNLLVLSARTDFLEWVGTGAGATLNGYARSEVSPSPIFRVSVEETWEAAVAQAHALMVERKARARSTQNRALLLEYRRQALDDVLREYETYGAALTWEETEQARDRSELADEKVPYNRRHKPRYQWLCNQYAAVLREAESNAVDETVSKLPLRLLVAEQYEREFGPELRELYGKEEAGTIGEGTVRNALHEGLERGRTDYTTDDI
ncbi:MAG: hypothetical protein AAFN13_14145 [Bacteroidota bacterium]